MATRAKEKPETKPAAKPGHARVEVKALRAAMKAAGAVVERRNTVPLLAGVLITVGPSTMTITATDLDTELRQTIDLAQSGTGQAMTFVADAATLEKITAKLPADAEIEMTQTDAGRIAVSCGRSRFTLPTLPAEEFPLMSGGDWTVQFEMGRGEMQALISAVRFAMSSEETRYYLCGIHLEAVTGGPEAGEAGALIAAATDGHRLARWRCDLPDGAAGMPDIILGRKAVGVIDRLLDASQAGSIDIAIKPGRLDLSVDAMNLTTKLIDGQFPDYRRVIPTNNDKALWIDPKALVDAVERVTVVSGDDKRTIRLSVDGRAVTLSAQSPDKGEASEELTIDEDAGSIAIGFNGRYLIEVLGHLTASPALVKLGKPDGPALFVDAEDSRRTYVLMPMRV